MNIPNYFQQQLAAGLSAEQYVADAIGGTHVPVPHNKGWDILTAKGATLELKTDSHATNNCFFEFSAGPVGGATKPGGPWQAQSEYFAVYFPHASAGDNLYIWQTANLISVLNGMPQVNSIQQGGKYLSTVYSNCNGTPWASNGWVVKTLDVEIHCFKKCRI